MFAIALWNVKKRELWLIRDRIGIKPLYYSILKWSGSILLQRSSASWGFGTGKDCWWRSVLPLPFIPNGRQRLWHCLQVLRTPCGYMVEYSRRWHWVRQELLLGCMGSYGVPCRYFGEWHCGTKSWRKLRTAVKLRKVSDVPVGVFLQGASIKHQCGAILWKWARRPIKTFTIGYEGEYQSYPNELQYARQMAAQVGAEYHEKMLTQNDLLDFLPHMIYLQDEPIADPVCVPV